MRSEHALRSILRAATILSLAALFGLSARGEESAGVRDHHVSAARWWKKIKVDRVAAELYGKGDHDSVGAWWESLDCRLMRVAAGDGSEADPSSASRRLSSTRLEWRYSAGTTRASSRSATE